ncbi:MAG: hypothetical protein WBM57_12915 [Woeseiaceae bacterium]
MQDCIGGLRDAEVVSRDTKIARTYTLQSSAALQGIETATPAAFTSADAQFVQSEVPILQADAEKILGQGEMQEAQFRASIDRTNAIGSALVRYELLDDAGREKIDSAYPELSKTVTGASRLVAQLAPALRTQAQARFPSSLERTLASSNLSAAAELLSLERSVAPLNDSQAIAYSWGWAQSPDIYRALADWLRTLRAWLLARLDKRPPSGECSLIREVNAIAIPGGNQPDPNAVISATEALFRAFLRYLLDCICAALLPPCPPCDDTGVKLACFDFDDCEVDNICNLERTFLLTGPNLRYWIPLLHQIGEAFERLCCTWAAKLDQPFDIPQDYTHGPATTAPVNTMLFSNNQPTYSAIAADTGLPNLLGMAGISTELVEPGLNLSGSLGGMVIAEPALNPLAGMLDAGTVSEMAVDSVLAQPSVSSAIDRAVASRIDTVTQQPSSDSAIVELDAKVEESLQRLDRELEKRATLDGLPNTKVIRDLRQANDEQAKRLDQLLSANNALMARIEKLESGGRT